MSEYRIERDEQGCYTNLQLPSGELVKIQFSSISGPWHSGMEELRYTEAKLTDNSVVVDVGAYKGEFCEKLSSKCQCKIYAYEPVEKYYKELVGKIDVNKTMKNVLPHKVALSAKESKEEIVVSDEGSTLTRYSRDMSGTTEVIDTIDVVDELDWIMNENKKEGIDLIKINIEGGEFDLLPVLIDSGTISKIKNVHVQFHSFVEDSYIKYLQLKQEMSKTHDVVLDSLWKWTFWKRRDG